MKKILFVVDSNINNSIGTRLRMDYPYGRTDSIEWLVTSAEYEATEPLKRKISKYDIVYEVKTAHQFSSPRIEDLVIVGNIHTETLAACAYVNSPYIIWQEGTKSQKRPLADMHLSGITLYYRKTEDAQYDYMRIKADFLNIVYKRISRNTPKHLYKAERSVSLEEKQAYKLRFEELAQLNTVDKQLLSIPYTDHYIATFVQDEVSKQNNYCDLNKKVRDVIHFDAWLQLSVKKTD